jgi:hypothetical protein
LKISTIRTLETRQGNGRKSLPSLGRVPIRRESVLKEEILHAMLALERRRAERSRKPFVLMLLDSSAVHTNGNHSTFVGQLSSTVCDATRETDLVGWYEDGVVLAVIFTEVNLEGQNPVTEILHSKVVQALRDNLDPKFASKLAITVHLFPEDWKDKDRSDPVADIKLYPDLSSKVSRKRFPMAIKRGIDMLGSGLLLALLSPVLGAIALPSS